jgi:hypothetical protein
VLLGLNVTVQEPPVWLTLKSCPPMSSDPVRVVEPALAAIE